MKRAIVCIVVMLQSCSFATLPRPRPSPAAAPSCPIAPPLVDAGLGIGGIVGSVYWAKAVNDGPWRDVPRGLLLSAALAAGMIVAFGSATYGVQANTLCGRFDDAMTEQQELRKRRLEAWALVKQAIASDCAVALELGSRVQQLDLELYATAMAPTIARCLEVPAPAPKLEGAEAIPPN